MKQPANNKHSQNAFTSAEMVVSTMIMAILGIVFLNVLNSGMILYTKNTAVNSAHQEARSGINQMTRDIHASISVPQLRTADAAALSPTSASSVVSSTPTGTSAPMAAGVSFQDVSIGPQYVWKDPSGNGPIMVKGTYNTPEAPTTGMHFVAPLFNVEDDIVKVTATPTQASHHNVWVANGGETLVANKTSLFGSSGATYSIIYYTTRMMYLVKNGWYIPDSNGPYTLTVANFSSGTAQRYNLQNGSYVPNATGTYTATPAVFTSGNAQRYRYERGELHLYKQAYNGSSFYWNDVSVVAKYVSNPMPFYIPLTADSAGSWYESTSSYQCYTTSSSNSTGNRFNGSPNSRYVGVKLTARDPSSSNRGYLATASLLNTQIDNHQHQRGNGLVVVVSVIATVLTILGAAVSYTGHISRISQRSRRTALAVEIADGHLEYLFTNWRNIYRATSISYSSGSGGTNYALLPTNYFFTTLWNPGPAPSPVPNMTPAATPALIPTPAKTNFPTEPNYTVTQYRIQAVDPMIDLDSNENALLETSWGSGNFTPMPKATPYPSPSSQLIPPPAYGQNTWQYSFYYLAAVDVSVPALGTSGGTVTAKVRRVFEKKFDNPWTYAMFYVHDLELQPTTTFQLDGRITTNGNLYIGNNSVTIVDNSTDQFPSTVTYSGQYVNGYSPNDTYHNASITAPTFPANELPVQGTPYLPFGWNVNFSGSGGNNDSYHEIIETPVSGTDPLSQVRMYNQADYRVTIDQNMTITVVDYNGATPSSTVVNAIKGAMTTNVALQDNREGTYVRITDVNVGTLTTLVNNGTLVTGSNGNTGLVLYIKDTTPNGTSVTAKIGGTGSNVQTTERAIRLKNGATLPTSGLTVVSENPVYIQGDYNTGGTPPSDSGTWTSPTVSGYTRKPSAVYADAVNILSGAWSDLNSTLNTTSRVATNTTVNTALVTGEVPSGAGNYSGGGENFVRYLEDWSGGKTFTYYGSMVELFNSVTATGVWKGSGNQYKQPAIHWYYDTTFSTSAPPGNIQIAAYLQQQRWYQVY